jgi:4-diphosphocytidyl-2-C-methyl-D-erythritol kinase
MLEHAPAKVNLYLHVTGRRADGYHLLDSLAVFGPAADTLHAEPAEKLSLVLDGPFGEALSAEPDNLVLRASRALAPRGAMLLLNRLWGTGRDEADLAVLAAPLGADIPVCVASRPAVMQGVGELIRPAPALPECGLLLVNPLIPLATPAVFRARQGGFSPPAALPDSWPDAAAMAADLGRLANDLEAPALSLCPAIAEVLAALRAQPGCLLARMSGSGATCFGLFATAAGAERAAQAMPPAWWASGGGLYGGGPASLHPGIGGV